MNRFLRLCLCIVFLFFVLSCKNSGDGDTPASLNSWGTPELIETDTTQDAQVPQIAMDNVGNAISIWQQNDGTRWNIWANYYNGTSWGIAELLETDDNGSVANHQIAMNGSGHAVAIWEQDDGTRRNIWANHFNGSSWSSAELIETNDGSADHPQVAMDSTGNAMAVWSQNEGTISNIWANFFNGTSWGTPVLIETNDSLYAWSPQIAMNEAGHALAIWRQEDTNHFDIWFNYFNGSAWTTAKRIATYNTNITFHPPQVAMDSSGNAIAIWAQHDGTNSVIWTSYFNGTTWDTPNLLESNDSGSHKIAMNGSGKAIAVWYQYDGTRTSIMANYFNGAAWGSPELIEFNDFEYADYPQIAIDSAGNAIAVWCDPYSIIHNIWANHFDGTTWGIPRLLEHNDNDLALNPQIAMNDEGNAIAVWQLLGDSPSNAFDIWANVFK